MAMRRNKPKKYFKISHFLAFCSSGGCSDLSGGDKRLCISRTQTVVVWRIHGNLQVDEVRNSAIEDCFGWRNWRILIRRGVLWLLPGQSGWTTLKCCDQSWWVYAFHVPQPLTMWWWLWKWSTWMIGWNHLCNGQFKGKLHLGKALDFRWNNDFSHHSACCLLTCSSRHRWKQPD